MVKLDDTTLTTTVVGARLSASLAFTLTDDQYTNVAATVAWGDGTSSEVVRQAKPVTVSLVHDYPPGDYVVQVTARNFSLPAPSSVTWSGQVTFLPAIPDKLTRPPVLLGPILPRLTGAPNTGTWLFDLGADAAAVESDLTLLLGTAKGEYLTDPDFGTNLRARIFSLNEPSLTDDIRADIVQAVGKYVPAAEVISLDARAEGRRVLVSGTFRSRLTNQTFPVTIPVTR